MNYNRDKMAKVAVDLQNVAASLAEAQRSGAISISDLDAALQRIDNQIDYELSLAAANGETVDVSELRQAAVDRTATALGEVRTVRDAYSHQLDESRAQMAAEGYTPDATAVDGEGDEPETARRQADAGKYDAGQRGRRPGVGELAGSMDSREASRRGTATRFRDDQRSDGEASMRSATRASGWRLPHGSRKWSATKGSRDGRRRPHACPDPQEWQQRLERATWAPPMTPDQATEWLNRSEAQGRAMVLDRLQEQLQQSGMSPEGAAAATEAMSRGIVPKELVEFAQHGSKVLAGEEQAFKYHREGFITTGQHWKPDVPRSARRTSPSSRRSVSSPAVSALPSTLPWGCMRSTTEYPRSRSASKVGGGAAGAWAGGYAGAWAGTFLGPPGVRRRVDRRYRWRLRRRMGWQQGYQ